METIAELVPDTVMRWTDDAGKANVVVAESNRRAALGFRRAQADFGFSPGLSLRDGIREYLAFLAATERESA
jgi:hypothetical protein